MPMFPAQTPSWWVMGMKFSISEPFKYVRAASAALKFKFNPAGPIRLTIVCAVLLSVIVAVGIGLFLSTLRDRELASNEETLSNTALIVSEQIENLFTTVSTVQREIVQQTADFTNLGEDGFEREVSSYNFHVKLRDKVSGMPYVAALMVFNAKGRLINLSRPWPIPDIDSSDRDYVKAFQSDKNLSSFISEPIRNRVNGTWVVQLARKISGPNGEFFGLTTAAIELQHLEAFFNRIAAKSGSGMGLFRNDGTVFIRTPTIESDIGRRIPIATSLKLVSTGDHGVGMNTGALDGQARVVAAHRIGSYPVLVSASRTVAMVFADWKRTAMCMIIVAVLIMIAIAAFAILFIKKFNNHDALTKALAERDNVEKIRVQGLRLDAALNNMSQGLAMFDSSERIILCNQRYMDIYALAPDAVKRGRTLRELLGRRQALGSFAGDIEEYRLELLNGLARGETRSAVATDTAGHSHRVINVPMAGGGWVATHEDVTEKLRAERVNEQQKFQLDTALANMTQGLCLFDGTQRLIVCNKRYAELYGLNDEQTKPGTTLRTILEYRVSRGAAAKNANGYISDRIKDATANKPYKKVNMLSDGRYISVAHRPTKDGGWVATHEDVTEQQHAERELDETKRFLDSIIANIPIAVVVKDAKTHKFVLTNRTFEATLGLSGTDLMGKTVFDLYGAEDAERIDKADSECLQGSASVVTGEFEVENPLLGSRILSTKRIVIRDKQGCAKYLVVVIEDITERKNSEGQIAFMAHHDALTGLANRTAVAQKIEDAAAHQRRGGDPFTVLMLDLDRFKQVNDTLGHSVGDTLLREVATRLKAALRETDLLARLGGDEFAIIQTGETNQREAASTFANRIISIIAKPFNIEGSEVNIGVSIGISMAPEHAIDPDSLFKMADLALYRAKSAGRNGYQFFTAEMSVAAGARSELETDLRRAIQQGELELYYQPVIDTKTSRISGAEALIRWRHPIKGMISPDQFIPLAEETGLITQIGEWVLHRACDDAASWPDEVKVAVNLSPVQFRKTNLPDIVMCALAQSGLPPKRLELEITETALIESAAECLPALRQFKNLGISIALDDFGTGYSSLSLLTIFPFDKIKIDKSFTQNMTKRADCAAIISAVLALAQNLDIATTAEGVETEDQYRLLRLAGVTSLQGYLFKRPCPISEIDFDSVYDCARIENAA
jgi:diguanylate cyclase (GGDEF)-like protein/PAS domain S-box-containing protein